MDHVQSTYTLDEHQVTLSKTNNRLLLEIETTSTGRSFSLELENDAISQVTNEIFEDVKTMHKGLEDALNLVYKEVSLVFDGKGMLTYQVSLSLGTIKKNIYFTLSFQEKKLDPLTRLERKLENRLIVINAKIADIEQADKLKLENNKEIQERIKRLEINNEERMKRLESNNEGFMEQLNNFEKRVFEKLEKLDRKVASIEDFITNKSTDISYVNGAMSRLEKKLTENYGKMLKRALIEEVIQRAVNSNLTFNPQSYQVSNFTLSNNNKTAELKSSLTDRELLISKTLPPNGEFALSVRLDKIVTGIYLGMISNKETQKNDYCKTAFYYVTTNGSISRNSSILESCKNSSIGFGKEGDTLTVECDIDEGRVVIKLNHVIVNYIDVNLKDATYIPYCGFGRQGCKITII